MKPAICGVGLALFVLLAGSPLTEHVAAASNFSVWSAPINLGPVVNSPFMDFAPAVSKNGLSLYFSSDRPGGLGSSDIWVSQRDQRDDPWGVPVNLGGPVNTSFGERAPCFSRDGHWMFFVTERPGGFGGDDIWASWRTDIHDDFAWQPPINLGAGINTGTFDAGASFFENDEAGTPLLFFGSTRVGGPGGEDIYVSAQTADGSFGVATLVSELSSSQADRRPTIRFDGLEIIFFSNRPGTLGGADLWASTRPTVFDVWSQPVNLGAVVNSTANEAPSYLSSDGRVLFLTSDRPGGFGSSDLYMTTRDRTGGLP
jgi:Tol biopolymer transport system component